MLQHGSLVNFNNVLPVCPAVTLPLLLHNQNITVWSLDRDYYTSLQSCMMLMWKQMQKGKASQKNNHKLRISSEVRDFPDGSFGMVSYLRLHPHSQNCLRKLHVMLVLQQTL